MSGSVFGEVFGDGFILLPDPSTDPGTPQLSLCLLIAEALDGQTFGGFTINAKSTNLLPLYAFDDLQDTALTVDVVPSAEFATVEQHTHGTALEDCPVVVSIEAQCPVSGDDTNYRGMLKAVRDISVYLQSLDLSSAGFHGPFANTFEDRPETVDGSNRFEGYVSLTYRTVTNV